MPVIEQYYCTSLCVKVLLHSSQKPTRKLAVRTSIQSQYLKALAVNLRVGFLIRLYCKKK